MIRKGHQLDAKEESFVDSFYFHLYDNIFSDIFIRLRFSANDLTSFSFICGLLSCQFLFERKKYVAALFWFFQYIFDCFDGQHARYTNTVTTFGDYYDHLTDIITFVIMFFVIFHKKKLYAFLFLATFIITINYLRIQIKKLPSYSVTLDALNYSMFPTFGSLTSLKYFGSPGFANLMQCLIIILVCK